MARTAEALRLTSAPKIHRFNSIQKSINSETWYFHVSSFRSQQGNAAGQLKPRITNDAKAKRLAVNTARSDLEEPEVIRTPTQ